MFQVISSDVTDLPLVLSLACPPLSSLVPLSTSVPLHSQAKTPALTAEPCSILYDWVLLSNEAKIIRVSHPLSSTLFLSHPGLCEQTPPLSCPQALSARPAHCTKGWDVHPPRGQVLRSFVCVWQRATSTPDTRPCACCTVPPALSDSPVPCEMFFFFSLVAFFPVVSYYLFVFSEAKPYLLATSSLMYYYPKLIFLFNFRNMLVWFVWKLLFPLTVATACCKLHWIMLSNFLW